MDMSQNGTGNRIFRATIYGELRVSSGAQDRLRRAANGLPWHRPDPLASDWPDSALPRLAPPSAEYPIARPHQVLSNNWTRPPRTWTVPEWDTLHANPTFTARLDPTLPGSPRFFRAVGLVGPLFPIAHQKMAKSDPFVSPTTNPIFPLLLAVR